MKKISTAILVVLLTVAASAQTLEKAHVLFYRPHNAMLGNALKPSIYFDRTKVTSLPNGRYFAVEVAQGKYSVRADDNALFAENVVSFEAGKHYYIRMSLVGSVKGAFLGGVHLQLDVIPPDEAFEAMKKLKPLDHPPYALETRGNGPL